VSRLPMRQGHSIFANFLKESRSSRKNIARIA
jgi:hypothetical protein